MPEPHKRYVCTLCRNIPMSMRFRAVCGLAGGDLGFFTRGKMVKEFDSIVFTQEPGFVYGPGAACARTYLMQHEPDALTRRVACWSQ